MDLRKKLLVNHEICLGSFLNIPSASFIELIGYTGYDFNIIDYEHGAYHYGMIEDCLRASQATNTPCIVRVGSTDGQTIANVLDMGAHGIQLPQITSTEGVEDVLDNIFFRPKGKRGYGSTTRASRYGCLSRQEVIAKTEQETLVVVQLESVEGLERLAEIVKIPRVDLIFIGTGDLSLSLGYDSPNDERILKILEKVVPQILKSNKVAGVFLSNPNWLNKLIDLGITYFAISAAAVAKNALKKQVEIFNDAICRTENNK